MPEQNYSSRTLWRSNYCPGSANTDEGIVRSMEHLPSPGRAERNQRRKLAFIPIWPVVAAIVLVALLVAFAR